MSPTSRLAVAARGVAGACVVALALAPSAGAANLTLHDIPTAGSGPTQIVNGPDGRLWFTESKKHEIGRIDPSSGQFAPIPLPFIDEATADDGTVRLVRATNGYMWTLDNDGQELYRIDGSGSATHVKPYGNLGLDGLSSYDDALSMPDELVPANGGGVWTLFSHHNPSLPGNDYNGATTVNDSATPHLVTSQTYGDPHPGALNGGDGSLWIADSDYVTRVGTDGAVRRLPVGLGALYDVSSSAFAPDGTLWFTAYESGSWFTSPSDGVLGHVVDNQVQITKLTTTAVPTSLRVGPDGALWWAETQGAIGRRDPASGAIQEGSLGNYKPAGIAFAGNGTLWFVDTDANVAGQIGLDGALFPAPAPPAPGPTPPGPKPTPAPAPAVAQPAVTSSSLRVRKHRIAVGVSCPKAAKATCVGTVRLRTAAKVKLRGTKRKAIATVSTSGSYALKPGKAGTVSLKLSRTGRTLVRHGRTTKVSVQLTPKGATAPVASRTVKLKG